MHGQMAMYGVRLSAPCRDGGHAVMVVPSGRGFFYVLPFMATNPCLASPANKANAQRCVFRFLALWEVLHSAGVNGGLWFPLDLRCRLCHRRPQSPARA
jgi:hypothetical protein